MYNAIILIVVAIFLIALYVKNVVPFLQERSYIKMEIERSFSESEAAYWKKELKKLYIEHIPIFHFFLWDFQSFLRIWEKNSCFFFENVLLYFSQQVLRWYLRIWRNRQTRMVLLTSHRWRVSTYNLIYDYILINSSFCVKL